jgi:carboxyl-terminal processing protease
VLSFFDVHQKVVLEHNFLLALLIILQHVQHSLLYSAYQHITMLSIVNTPKMLGICLLLCITFHAGSAGRVLLDQHLPSTYRTEAARQRELEGLALPTGLWTSRGYGWAIVSSSGDNDSTKQLTLMEETAISCIQSNDLLKFFGSESAEINGDTAVLTTNPPVVVTEFFFDRGDSFQAACGTTGLTPVQGDADYVRDALQDFDIVVQTFREQYAAFDRRVVGGICDWEAVTVNEARANLQSDSTDDELFEALVFILDPMNDNHVGLLTDVGFFVSRPWEINDVWEREFEQQQDVNPDDNFDMYRGTQLNTWIQIVDGWMEGGLHRGNGSGLSWGQFRDGEDDGSGSGDVGYMQVSTFSPSNVSAFLSEVDAALLDLQDMDAMVIDVRINEGGLPPLSLFLASHFSSDRVMVYKKRALDSDGGYTEFQEVYIEPASNPKTQFGDDKPVIVIISGATVSAAETFTLVMSQLPQTTLLGRNTAGAISNQLRRKLPNGWMFALANEEISTLDGTVYEAVGIPPDVLPEAELLPMSEREAGIDSWLELALETAMGAIAEDVDADSSRAFTELISGWKMLMLVGGNIVMVLLL